MPFPRHFSLARFAPRMHKQEGDVLVFEENALVVRKRNKELHRFPYDEIHRLQYFHFPVTLSRAFQFLSGGLFQRREARFRVEIKGERHDPIAFGFWLEADLEFRTGDLVEIFRALYRKDVPLEEYSHSANRLFLLEGIGRDELERRKAEMKGKV